MSIGPAFIPPAELARRLGDALGLDPGEIFYLLGFYAAYLTEQGALIDISPARHAHPAEEPAMNPVHGPGFDLVSSGMAPGGLYLHFYDGQNGGLILERAIDDAPGAERADPADTAAVIDQALAEIELVAYDGDTGSRLPLTFGLVCRLRPSPAS